MNLEERVRNIRAGMKRELPFALPALAVGCAAYMFTDLIGHANMARDHGIPATIAGASTVVGYIGARYLHGSSCAKKRGVRPRKKGWDRDDTAGLAVAGIAGVATGYLPNVVKNTLKYAQAGLEQFVYPGAHHYDQMGIPYSQAMQSLNDSLLAFLMNSCLREDILLLGMGYALFRGVGFVSSSVSTKRDRSLFYNSLKSMGLRYVDKDRYVGFIHAHADKLPELSLELMQYHLKQKDYSEAFLDLKKYLRAPYGSKTMMTAAGQKGLFVSLSVDEKALANDPKDVATNLRLATSYLVLGDRDDFRTADAFFSRCCDIAPPEQAIDYSILYGLFLSARKDDRALRQWKNAAEKVVGNPAYAQERIGETAELVYAKGSPFTKKTLLFKEYASEGKALLDRELTGKIQDALSGYANARTIEHMAFLEVGGRPVSVMLREEGETLWERIQGKKPVVEDCVRISSVLAYLHKAVNTGIPEEDIMEKAKSRLSDASLGIPEVLQQRILLNYSPIAVTLEHAVWSFSKDAHPENWIVRKDAIVCIDNEGRPDAPVQCDLASLMEYGDYLTWEEKDRVLSAYLDSWNSYGGITMDDEDSFRFCYLNAVVHRAISLSSVWSSPTRKGLWGRREVLVQNAIGAIMRIGESFPEEYRAYQKEYEGLRESLEMYSSYLHVDSDR